MKRMFKYLLRTILVLFFLIVIWVIGLCARLPLIPWIETDYFIKGTNQTLADGFNLKQSDNTIIKIEIPNEFSEKEQCFDFWFLSSQGKHLLTVNDFSLKTFENNNSEIRRDNSYLFWDNGSKDETFMIQDYEIEADTIHG